jgi:galactosamine-6-phosphate isomerase
MLESLQDKPTLGLTLGMADILKSRRIILLVTGEGKNAAMESLRQQKIDPGLPVSLLWLHPDVSCFLDDSTVS